MVIDIEISIALCYGSLVDCHGLCVAVPSVHISDSDTGIEVPVLSLAVVPEFHDVEVDVEIDTSQMHVVAVLYQVSLHLKVSGVIPYFESWNDCCLRDDIFVYGLHHGVSGIQPKSHPRFYVVFYTQREVR